MFRLRRIENLARRSKSIAALSLLVVVIVIGVADYITGNELSFWIFYLLPISLASWFVGKRMGVFISVASFTALLSADLLAGGQYSHPAIPYWNGVMRLGSFVIVVLILSQLKREYTNELELNAELQAALKRLEQKQEELKQKAEDLAHSNAELEKFAYVAAHDLRGPLIGIGGYVQHLRRRLKDKLDPEDGRVLEQVLGQVARMEDLIHALLGYARVGTARLEVKRVDLNEIIHQVVSDLQAEIEKSAALVTSDPLPTIWADGTQIRQLLQNLVSNGIKFHGQELPRVHLSARKGEVDFLFSVRDNGIGIDSKDQDRIFEMFQRLHNNPKYPGSGIGLAISKKIVENHRGRIWVESELQKGTIFHFTIPVKEPSESA